MRHTAKFAILGVLAAGTVGMVGCAPTTPTTPTTPTVPAELQLGCYDSPTQSDLEIDDASVAGYHNPNVHSGWFRTSTDGTCTGLPIEAFVVKDDNANGWMAGSACIEGGFGSGGAGVAKLNTNYPTVPSNIWLCT